MGKIVLQMFVLAALALAAAAVANFSRSGNEKRFLDWWPEGRYTGALQVKGCLKEGPAPDGAPVRGGAVFPPPVASDRGTDGGGGRANSEVGIPAVGISDGGTPDGGTPDGGVADGSGEAERFPHVYYPGVIEEMRGGATFVDARRSEQYLKGHIPGAHSVPAWESPGEKVNALLERGDIVPAAPAVVYCSSSKECEDSLIVSNLLEQAGFEVVKIYKGGFPEWKHKLPKLVITGEAPGEVDYDALPDDGGDDDGGGK
jgi:rhodanese-related sulfurtransferase